MIASSCNHDALTSVSAALKTQWTEKRLLEHDRDAFPNKPRAPLRHNYWEAGDAEKEDIDMDDLLADAIAREFMAEGDGLEEDPPPDDEENMAVLRRRPASWRKPGPHSATPKPPAAWTRSRKGGAWGDVVCARCAFHGNCLRCGKAGHRARERPQAESSGAAAADHHIS